MFPSSTTPGRPTKRSFRELVRGAVDTALEFATLGEAPARPPARQAGSTAPTSEHPHRRPLRRRVRARRPGMGRPRAQVCITPVPHHPARRH